MSENQSSFPIHFDVIDLKKTQAPWLVMVHGFTHNSGYFSAQIVEFQNDFRLLLVDLRGHGGSTNTSGPFGIEEYADDIECVLDGLGIKSAHYWGTHTGSGIGLVLALRRPERFLSLVLEGTFLPGFPMPAVGELTGRARSIARAQGVAPALEDWFANAGWNTYIRTHPLECRAAEHRALLRQFTGAPWFSDLAARPVTPVAERLAQIQRPALVYNGVEDMEDFKRAALYLEAGLPDVRRAEILDAGGFPGWENPRVVNGRVRDFLYHG